MLHGSLKPDLHHWSADSLGLFLCSYGWDTGPDLSRYLEAIAILKEEVSFRAFHPFFAPGTFPLKSARARQACRYLFDFFEPVLRRRLAFRSDSTAPQDTLGKLAPLHRDARQSATPWSHEDCVEELISLVAEGTGAMSYTVAQALVLLSRNPDAQQAAWEQARLVEPAQVEQGRAGTGKAVNQPAIGVRCMLRNFAGKGSVIEAKHLLKFFKAGGAAVGEIAGQSNGGHGRLRSRRGFTHEFSHGRYRQASRRVARYLA